MHGKHSAFQSLNSVNKENTKTTCLIREMKSVTTPHKCFSNDANYLFNCLKFSSIQSTRTENGLI